MCEHRNSPVDPYYVPAFTMQAQFSGSTPRWVKLSVRSSSLTRPHVHYVEGHAQPRSTTRTPCTRVLRLQVARATRPPQPVDQRSTWFSARRQGSWSGSIQHGCRDHHEVPRLLPDGCIAAAVHRFRRPGQQDTGGSTWHPTRRRSALSLQCAVDGTSYRGLVNARAPLQVQRAAAMRSVDKVTYPTSMCVLTSLRDGPRGH